MGKGKKAIQSFIPTRNWHSMESIEIFSTVDTAEHGLTEGEAQSRLTRYGRNVLSVKGGTPWYVSLGRQFIQPLVVILVGAAVLSIVLKDYVDAAVIAGVVLINAVIGFVQEFRAEKAISALGKMIVTEATVLRDGALKRVHSADLVVGDVVMVQSGDAIPADLRLFHIKDLRVEEAALTGESVPVEKREETLPLETVLADRTNLAFAGSAVIYGQARGIVVAAGNDTEAGKIAGLMARTKELETPLTSRIAQLSRFLVWAILSIAGVLFIIEILRGRPMDETFNAAVALAVGAIPEGLPAAVTILLAVGVSSMAKRRALIRKLPAVETLGSTTVICSDKTGTLTENQMTVTVLYADAAEVQVRGVGFEADGAVERNGIAVTRGDEPTLEEILRCGALCNDTRVLTTSEGIKIEGDPTEAALTIAARKLGISEQELERWPRIDVVPFESAHMYMATLHHAPEGVFSTPVAYIKGSSDSLLARCVDRLSLDGRLVSIDHTAMQKEVEALAERGLRVLVVARRLMNEGVTKLGHQDIEGLTFLGLVGMIDPPRKEAKRATAACQSAGIKVKMITGDHAVTATAVAMELGIEGETLPSGKLRVVTGRQLAELTEEELPAVADSAAVFARVAPEQKLGLVKALQSRGHIVAMTGDGVNDAPALKQADIGVSMGKNGTDVARSASAMILTDDNFATIAASVEEGRGVFDNLVKFITWTLPTNGGEAAVLLVAVIFGTQLPVLPVQLLWVNMMTAVLLGTALIFEPREPGLMQRQPRPVNAPILNMGLAIRTLLVSLAVGACAFGMFEWALVSGLSDAAARTIAVNTVVAMEVGYLFACRSLHMTVLQLGFFSNRWVFLGALAMLVAQLVFTYVPIMNRLFHSAPIDFTWWAMMSGISFATFLAVEVVKHLRKDTVASTTRSA